jgi:hypothetical protein
VKTSLRPATRRSDDDARSNREDRVRRFPCSGPTRVDPRSRNNVEMGRGEDGLGRGVLGVVVKREKNNIRST